MADAEGLVLARPARLAADSESPNSASLMAATAQRAGSYGAKRGAL